MAEQIVLTDLVNLQNETTAVTAINSNNAVITEAFLDVLSRSGVQPNPMESTLDMNSNHIINLPAPLSDSEPVRLQDVTATPYGALGTMSLQNATGVVITGGTIAGTSLAASVTGVTETTGTNNTTLATTAFVIANQSTAVPATAVPLVDSGSGAVGTSALYARQDHVHPITTGTIPAFATRAALIAANPSGFNTVTVLQSYQNAVTDPTTPATYARLGSTPSPVTRGHIQDSSGAYWQNVSGQLWASQFRLSADGTNWAPAIQAMIAFATTNQICNIETTTAPLYIAPTTWTTHVFEINTQIQLQGGNLYWDSGMGNADLFWINNVTNNVIQYLKIRNMIVKPSTNFGILPTDLFVAHSNGLVYGNNIFTIKDGSFTQYMEISGCVFGPMNNFGIQSMVTQPDYFRGLNSHGNNYWNGHFGMIGDSCSWRDDTINGFQPAWEIWQGPGSTLCEIEHCNVFTNGGTLAWLGGDRLRFCNNNCEQYGPKTVGISAMVDIANSSNSTNNYHIFEGNHLGLLLVPSGTFAGLPTGLSRVMHIFNQTGGKLDCNDFLSTDTGCTNALVIDSSSSGINLRPTNQYISLSLINNGTGTITT